MRKMKILVVLIILATLGLSACGGSDAEPTATLSVEQIQTMAVTTYQAQLTQTALALPTSTPFPTNTPIPVVTFASPEGGILPTATNTTVSGGGQAASCYDLSYIKDVTIPDNTAMTPGQTFTKKWLVLNNGSCDWEPGFIFNVVGGDAMGGVAVTLNQTVQTNRQYEFSVDMVAPTDQTGEIKGTWRLADADGNFFGDGVFVLINVGGTAATSTSYPNP